MTSGFGIPLTLSHSIENRCNPHLVAALEKAIFVTDRRMITTPLLHEVDEKLYLAGGRHRLKAIENVFVDVADVGNYNRSFAYALNIRVLVLYNSTLEDLNYSVESDNSSRKISRSTRTSLIGQRKGATVKDPITFLKVALSLEQPGAVTDQLALYFVEKFNHPLIDSNCAYSVGKVLGDFIMYGTVKRRRNTAKLVDNALVFGDRAEVLWNLVCRIVEDKDTIGYILGASAAKEIAKEAIETFIKTK